MMPKICRQKFDIWQNMLYCNKNPPKNKHGDIYENRVFLLPSALYAG